VKRHLIKLVTLITLIAIVGALVFTGCAEEEEPPPPPPPPPVEEEEEPPPPPVEEVWQWPERIALVTSAGVGMAAVVGYTSAMSQDTGMTIRVVPESNTMLRFKWVQEARFLTTAEDNLIIQRVLEGLRGYATRDGGPFQLRLLWAMAKGEAGFMVRGDSDLYTVNDLKPGTKFVDLVFSPGMFETSPTAALAWAGLTPDDIVKVPVGSPGAAVRAVTSGQADVTWMMTYTPDVVEATATPHGIRWLDFPYDEDPEGYARWLEVVPVTGLGVMFATPESTGIRSIVVLSGESCSANADPDLIYHWVKWIDENYELFKDNHFWNQFMTVDNTIELVETGFIPAHEGTVRYLTEIGRWTPAHEARNQQNIELMTRYVEAYQEAMDMADERGIEVVADNDEWIELWANYKQELNLPPYRVFAGLD
jgi:hypothetical protein